MKDYVINVLLATLAILSPIKPLLISCGFLIVGDMITGVWAAKKRGEKINSASMRRTVSKFVIYQLAIISGFALETYMLDSFIPVSKLVGSVIGMVEFKSLLENSSAIVGQDIIKMILEKLGSKNDKAVSNDKQ